MSFAPIRYIIPAQARNNIYTLYDIHYPHTVSVRAHLSKFLTEYIVTTGLTLNPTEPLPDYPKAAITLCPYYPTTHTLKLLINYLRVNHDHLLATCISLREQSPNLIRTPTNPIQDILHAIGTYQLIPTQPIPSNSPHLLTTYKKLYSHTSHTHTAPHNTPHNTPHTQEL